jgi:hypothetical protein
LLPLYGYGGESTSNERARVAEHPIAQLRAIRNRSEQHTPRPRGVPIGSGVYTSSWGFDAADRPVELVTDFELLVGPISERVELALPFSRGRIRHPLLDRHELTVFGVSTIERWYYEAKRAPVDPVSRLRHKVRKDRGRRIAITDALAQAIHALYEANRSWSYPSTLALIAADWSDRRSRCRGFGDHDAAVSVITMV